MPARFELKVASDGQHYFRLKAENGETILSSEMYKARAGAENGIASVKKNAAVAERYEKRTGASGKPYFVLKAANHEVIGTSETYETEAGRDNGIESVKANAPGAEIADATGA
jgi:uncharacterized protein YegP (UPF0339 family)